MFKRDIFVTLRKEQRKSAKYIADRIGKSRDAVTSWELGRAEPRERYIRLLAKELGVPISEISNLSEDDLRVGNLPSGTTFKDTAVKIKTLNSDSFKEEYNKLIASFNDMGRRIFQEFSHKEITIRALLDAIPSLLYIKDSDAKLVTANKAFIRHTGLSPEYELIGSDENAFLPKNEAKSNIEEDLNVLATGIGVIEKRGFFPSSKKKIPALISKIPVIDKNGKTLGLIGIFTDISEIVRSNLMNELFEFALKEHLSDGIFFIQTKQDKYIYANKSIESILGYTLEDFNSDKYLWKKILHPDDEAEFILPLSKVDEVDQTKDLVFRIIAKDGTLKRINSRFYRFIYDKETYTIGTLREFPLN